MRLKNALRKFFRVGPAQRAPSATQLTADCAAESSSAAIQPPLLDPVTDLLVDGASTTNANSRQNRNSFGTQQRTPSSDRRAEGTTHLSLQTTAVRDAQPPVDSHHTPVLQEPDFIKTGSQIVSDKVDCIVTLVYDGKPHCAHELDQIHWLEKSEYARFDYAVNRWLRDRGVPDSKQLYRKSGRCSLVSDDDKREFDSKILENEGQWSEVLPYLITSFVSKRPYIKFHLEIFWEYSDLSINKVDNEAYADTVRRVIHEKSKLNWENQRFIPRKDLVEILSDSTVKELINSDKSLNKIQGLDRDKFIQEVTLEASRLLAICVYVNLPLACLYELTQRGLSDLDLPLKEMHCPNGVYQVSFSSFVLWQGAFMAHVFENDGRRPKHRKLADEVVLPIICNKDEDLLGEGGFGMVYRVHIDPDHHLFSVVSAGY
jgi:hypothetical protein